MQRVVRGPAAELTILVAFFFHGAQAENKPHSASEKDIAMQSILRYRISSEMI